MSQLFLYFVETAILSVLELFSYRLAIFVNHYQDLLRFGHLQTDNLHDFSENLCIDLVERYQVGIAVASKRCLSCTLPLKVFSNIIMEEINCDFKHLIIIDFHHHDDVSETNPTNIDSILVTIHCLLKPFILVFEKLRIKVGDSPCQYFKDVAILFFDWVKHLLHFLVIVCEGDEIVQFLCYLLQHHQVFFTLLFIIFLYLQTSDLHQTCKSVVSQVIWRKHHD